MCLNTFVILILILFENYFRDYFRLVPSTIVELDEVKTLKFLREKFIFKKERRAKLGQK